MSHTDAKRRGLTLCRHRRDHDGPQVIMHFSWGHHKARTRFPDLTPDGGIEVDEPNVTTCHQLSSLSSSFPNSPINNSAPLFSEIFLAASAQPARTGPAGRRNTRASPSMVISASSRNPTWIKSGFGITTPCEFPICRMATRFVLMVITMLFLRRGPVKCSGAYSACSPARKALEKSRLRRSPGPTSWRRKRT